MRTIWDVIGKIKGSEFPDNWVVVGNHRDAWVYGAVDPNSGTAAMLEAVHGVGALIKEGWKPKRTIVFSSWDAEEEGLIGSTEWTEQHAKALEQAVAYFNVDVAVAGPDFGAESVPSLKQFVREVTRAVPSPRGGTVYDEWKSDAAAQQRDANTGHVTHANAPSEDVPVGDLGSGSDFTPFLQHIGVPSTDIGSHGDYGVYHSVFDNYAWYTQNADPTFVYLQEMARVLGLEALHMADADVLPICDYVTYGKEISAYLDAAKRKPLGGRVGLHRSRSSGKPLLGSSRSCTSPSAEPRHKDSAAYPVESSSPRNRDRVHLGGRAPQSSLVQTGYNLRPQGEYTGYSAVVIPGA